MAGRREQCLVLGVLGRAGRAAQRGSIMETATRNAPDGTAATFRPQAVGCAWARLAARLRPTPPASTMVGQDNRLVVMPSCLSRWRSRAAMTQVRSMQTATAQDIGPCWPCWAAVSRMWVNDPAPAITASAATGSASAIASRRRPALTSRPAARPVRDGPAARPRPDTARTPAAGEAARHCHCCAGAGPPRHLPCDSRLICLVPARPVLSSLDGSRRHGGGSARLGRFRPRGSPL